jgi:hypothetical protein
MIASPQVGTPEALAQLLHGDGLSGLRRFVINQSAFREAGETMIGAYTLLPSAAYFNRVSTPVIEFDPSLRYFRDNYGPDINTYTAQHFFLRGENGVRPEPVTVPCLLSVATQTIDPNVLRLSLLDRAEQIQANSDELQEWLPPGVALIQVAGWGLPTVRGIRYTVTRQCRFCQLKFSRTLLETLAGDETVVLPSAAAMNAPTFYFDLSSYNRATGEDRKHFNIMGARSVQELIRSLLKGNSNPSIDYLSTSPPVNVVLN